MAVIVHPEPTGAAAMRVEWGPGVEVVRAEGRAFSAGGVLSDLDKGVRAE